MKKLNFRYVLLSTFLVGMTLTTFADAEAKRKNKCKNNKFFKACAKTKGGSNNCGNTTTSFGWTCSENVTGAANPAFGNTTQILKRHDSSGGACTCGDFANTNLTKAAEASATSRSNLLTSSSAVFQFGCNWPNKWKAGSYSNYQSFRTNSPMLISTNQNSSYISSANIESSRISFDYSRSEVILDNLNAVLKKFTPDMVNDYATFIIDVSIVTGLDAAGNEIERSVYNCKVTIFDNKIIVDDASSSFTPADFNETNFATGGKEFKLNKTSKKLKLNEAVTIDSEINVTFSTDCGNYENGASSKYLINTKLIEPIQEEIKINQAVNFNILNNPVISDDIEFDALLKAEEEIYSTKFSILNFDGVNVSNIILPLYNKVQTYKISTAGLKDGIYILILNYKDKAYARKFIIDKNN